MAKLSSEQKREVLARIACVDYSGIEGRMSSNITCYSQSFVGRDFKVLGTNGTFYTGTIFDLRGTETLAKSFTGMF